MKKRMIVLALFLLVLPLVAAEYGENIKEGIFLIRPHNTFMPDQTPAAYLSSEDLDFFACIEYKDTPVRLSLLCTDDNNFLDVPATKWGPENCYLGSVDLVDFQCHNAVITADYVHNGENLRLTKEVRINKVTGALQKILDTQFTDGGWSSPLDTAFALFSIAPFSAVFNDSVTKGLAYLKDSRNEDDKCWPADQCQISTTASIVYLLNSAGYQDGLRIIRDGAIYLEKSMFYLYGGESWNLILQDHPANYNNTVNTSCVFGYDNSNTTYILGKYGTIRNISLSPRYGSIIRAVCTETVLAGIDSSVRGKIINYVGDNFSYTIPGPCWTFNNENVTCDLRATAYAIGTPIADDKRTAATQYLKNKLSTGVIGTQFADGDIMNSALLLNTGTTSILSSDNSKELVKYLLYRQANKGGWNATTVYYNYSFYEPQEEERLNYTHVLNDTYTRNIVYTGFAVQALLSQGYKRGDEVIQDADWWLSRNEESVSAQITDEDSTNPDIVAAYQSNVSDVLKDPKRNAMALYVLQQHARPLIKTSPRVIIMDKQVLDLDLVNPTTFTLNPLTYTLSTELQPYLTVEKKDYLAANSFRRIELSQTTNKSPSVFGYLRILQGSDEYAKIPVIIETYPRLNITFPSSMTVFGSTAILTMTVDKSYHNYSCALQWNNAGITSLNSFMLQDGGPYNLPIQFVKPSTEEVDYSGTLSCNAVTSTFTFPFTVRVNRFLTKPLSVSPSVLEANQTEQTLSFSVKNLLDESIDISLSLKVPSDYLEFSDYFLNLYPGETKNISLFVTTPKGENVSLSDAVLIKTFNIEERIPLTVEVTYEPTHPLPLWLVITLATFGIGLLGLVSYFGYTNRMKLLTWYTKTFKAETNKKKLVDSIAEYEKKEEALAIKNMIQIMTMQGASDKEIRKRLKTEGFLDVDIDSAIKAKFDGQKPLATAQRK